MKIKRGISLIVLVITIIVMIIIAGAIILSLNNSDILENARKAVFLENANAYRSAIAVNFSNLEKRAILKSSIILGENMKTYIPSMKEEDLTKYKIVFGELIALNTISAKEKEWLAEIDITNVETFITNYEYGTLYINPEPTLVPETFNEKILQVGDSYGDINVAFEVTDNIDNDEFTIQVMQEGEIFDGFPQCIAIHCETSSNNTYMYFWEEQVVDYNGNIFTMEKGWNHIIVSGNSITLDTGFNGIMPNFVNARKIIIGEGILKPKNLDYIGNYISTTPFK